MSERYFCRLVYMVEHCWSQYPGLVFRRVFIRVFVNNRVPYQEQRENPTCYYTKTS